MAYTKQTWADLPSKTTPINAERLTHIEDGIFDAAQTADTAASTAGTAAANVGIVSSKVETLTERVNGLDTAVSNKVDKVAGKGLSTNDYDDTDKGKVDSLGTASTKNSTSVVTESSDLVESGAVYDALGFGNKNLCNYSGENNTVVAQCKNGVTYTFSVTSTGHGGLNLKKNDNSGVEVAVIAAMSEGRNSVTFTADSDFNLFVNGYGRGGVAFADDVSDLQLELGSTATAYEPYHASVEETLRDGEVIDGKNLFPRLDKSLTINGITYTLQEDGSIIVNGTATNWATVIIKTNMLLKAGTYTVSGSASQNGTYVTIAVGSDTYNSIAGADRTFSLDADTIVDARISVRNGSTVTNAVFKPQLELGDAATTYEPYYIPLKDVVPNKCDNSVIGTVEDGTNPTKAYAVGEHMIRGGKFCTVTVAVTTSSTWTLGSNYVEGTIADNLVKQDTFSGTTTETGIVEIYNGNRNVIKCESSGGNRIIQPFYSHSRSKVMARCIYENGSTIENDVVSGTYYYI